jgi:RNA polymerase sigma factor for flagellar operon FliA
VDTSNLVEKSSKNTRRNELIDEYRSYVVGVVGYLIKSIGLPAENHDEFVAAGYLGLVEAADRFDFSTGKPFKNYAFLRIRGAIIDSIRECSDLRGRAYKYAQALKAAQELREALISDDPHAAQATGGPSLASFLEYAGQTSMVYRICISKIANDVTTDGGYGENPEYTHVESDKIKELHTLIATLPDRERLIVEGFYFQGKSYGQIGTELGLSKSWVCRVHSKAMELLLRKWNEADRGDS